MHLHEWSATFPTGPEPWEAEAEYRAAVAQGLDALTPLRRPQPLKDGDLPLFVVVRDEALFLESFLNHYRRLGVTRFVVVDNGSEDGSLEILAAALDVDLWKTADSYSAASSGRIWVDALAQATALGRWAVFVDADEFLVFPDMERLGLRGLAAQLEARGEQRLLAPMLDVYGEGPIADTHFAPGSDPLALPLWFDPNGYTIRRSRLGTRVVGGPRYRLLRNANSTFELTKFPFERLDAAALHPSPHCPFPYDRNPPVPRGALIHMKLVSDLARRAEAAIASGEYWMGSSDYHAYRRALEKDPTLSVWTERSRRYSGPEDLVSIGLVAPPPDMPITPANRHAGASGFDLADAPLSPRHRFGDIDNYHRIADRAARQLQRLSSPLEPGDGITLICCLRNEVAILPAFLAHYRQLGVTRFIAVDNGSGDGTREILQEAADVELYFSDASWDASLHGRLWIDGLARSRAMESWIIHCDADEFLVYDGMETHGLKALIGWMERRGLKRLYAPMLDVYPESLEQALAFRSGAHPLSVPHFFDRLLVETSLTSRGPMVYGGARCRIFAPGTRLMIELAKHPVTFWDATSAHVSNHTPHPYDRNARAAYGALLHFKFLGDIKARVEMLVAEGQHWDQGRAYKQILAGWSNLEGGSLLCDHSELYRGPESLVRTGFMLPIDWD